MGISYLQRCFLSQSLFKMEADLFPQVDDKGLTPTRAESLSIWTGKSPISKQTFTNAHILRVLLNTARAGAQKKNMISVKMKLDNLSIHIYPSIHLYQPFSCTEGRRGAGACCSCGRAKSGVQVVRLSQVQHLNPNKHPHSHLKTIWSCQLKKHTGGNMQTPQKRPQVGIKPHDLLAVRPQHHRTKYVYVNI